MLLGERTEGVYEALTDTSAPLSDAVPGVLRHNRVLLFGLGMLYGKY